MKNKVPKLRFPEFSGEWEEKRLENFFDEFRSGKGITTERIREIGSYPVYGGNGLRGFTTEYTHEGKYFLIGRQGALCGNINKFEGRAYVSEHAIACKANFTSDTEWLAQRLEYYNLNKISESSAQPGLSVNKLLKLKLTIPIKEEQEKIANFLSSVDTKIEKLEKKKELLEKYKKGMMQKLFSQKLRFKDENGNDYPEWEDKKLGEIAKYYDGTHQTPTYVEQGIPFYSVEHVTANQFKDTKFISEEVFKKENERVLLEKKDILMTRIGSIGKVKYIDWNVKASFYVSLALIKYNLSYNSKYLSFLIESQFFQKELWKRTIHVAFPKKINLREIGECNVLLPILIEQEKIANFLSSIDRKIELIEAELEKNKEFKKGLLQQMFV